MANEVLTRTPTSTGNRKKFTWAGWIKRNDIDASGGNSYQGIFAVGTVDGSEDTFMFSSDQIRLRCESGSDVTTSQKYRDSGNWMHVMMVVDTTLYDPDHRCIFYVNGVKSDVMSQENDITQNADLRINSADKHYLGEFPRINNHLDGQIADVFLVDGQALTPDVFGFYKDGDGYQSSGTTQATDFRPGQWSPHAPTKIKKDINRRGGFGANGFYLPMNDSSNPGADFHCAPNSIITLKGEDLPQPRNGAPTTSDAFVSQLRQETGTLGFDGAVKLLRTGGYLDLGTSHSDLVPGSGDFTIECFLYPQGFGNYPVIVDSRTSSGDTLGFFLGFNTNGQLYLYTHSGERNAIILTKGRWYHIALVRQSNVFKLYVDGVKVGTDYTQSQNYTNQIRYIGESTNSESQNWNIDAFISNFRFVKGTAVYTANFTAPTEPLTNVTNTKLLCCNSSTSATAATVAPGTITAVGGAFATRNELTGSTVLAVPGILDKVDLVTNGTFDSNTTGWTASNAVISSSNGTLKVDDSANSGSWSSAFQVITTVAGHTYRLELDVLGGNDARFVGIYQGTYTANSGTAPTINVNGSGYSTPQTVATTFTATGTSISIMLVANNDGIVYYDNVRLYDASVPVDYSADIKGSGTNKTLTANGNANIAVVPSYYGSAMTFDGTGDYFDISESNNEYDLDGDYTIEFWVNFDTINTVNDIIGTANNSAYLGSGKSGWIVGYANFSNIGFRFGYQSNSSWVFEYHTGILAVANQWYHIAISRSGSTQQIIINGVVCYSATQTNTITSTDNVLRVGGGFGSTSGLLNGQIQDARVYKGVAKYKGGFDVPKPYTPVGIEAFRTTADTCKNNFATLSPLLGIGRQDQLTYSEGNLKVVSGATGGFDTSAVSSMAIKGKIYCEFALPSSAIGAYVGVMKHNTSLTNNGIDTSGTSDCWIVRGDNGHKANGSTSAYAGSAFSDGDIIMMAVDIDNTSIWWGKNGTWFASGNPAANSNAGYTNLPSTEDLLTICGDNYSSETPTIIVNFGQNPSFSGTVTAGTNADDSGKGLFKYAPPSGFLALCEDNLPTPAIADPGDYFKSVLWDGDDNSGRSITGVGFQPDLVWLKSRTNTASHRLTDSVRGVNKQLMTDTSAAEATFTTMLTSFDSDGFTLGDNVGINGSGYTNVAWCWKAGGAAVSNTDGSITSQVSVNQTAGFSIVKFTGQGGSSSATVGHGLGKKPAFWIYKPHTNTTNWYIYHQSLGASAWLMFTNGAATTSNPAAWGGVEPTSTVLTHGSGLVNQGSCILYAWAEIEGFSKFGSYVGNASADGPFVYCGFKPAWVLIKKTNGSGNENWRLFDSSRCPTNQNNKHLLPSSSSAESTETGMDFLSNGFKLRHADAHQNQNGTTYIFMAFAESPFQTANAK